MQRLLSNNSNIKMKKIEKHAEMALEITTNADCLGITGTHAEIAWE
jgi:hypothetical protein